MTLELKVEKEVAQLRAGRSMFQAQGLVEAKAMEEKGTLHSKVIQKVSNDGRLVSEGQNGTHDIT